LLFHKFFASGYKLHGTKYRSWSLNLLPFSYLCQLHECTGFVAPVSKHSPPFSIGGQAFFFPTSKDLSQEPAGKLIAVHRFRGFYSSLLFATESFDRIE